MMRARQRVARVHLQQLMRVDYQDMAAEQLAAVFALHRPLASVPQLPPHLRNKNTYRHIYVSMPSVLMPSVL